MSNFCLWLLDILGSFEMILRFMFQLFFWLGVIFFLILWLRGSGGYEKLERQFEEENIRGEWAELKAKKSAKTKK